MKYGWVGWLVVLITGSIVSASPVHAQGNTMHDLTIDVQLLENGTAVITERRDMTMEEGTELFIVIEETDGVEVIDFYVEGMEEQTDWDSNASREDKAGSYGIDNSSSETELIWGIGDYGRNEYVVTYTLSNIVRQMEDGQSMHWNFNTFGDIPPENLTIDISGPFGFTQDMTRIWGFGYEGQIDLLDGEVRTYTQAELEDNQNVAVIVQFLNDPFLLSYYDERTLAEVVEDIEQDPGRGDAGGGGLSGTVISVIIGASVAFVLAILAVLVKIERLKKDGGKIPNFYEQRKRNKGMYYTDIPYKDGDITDVAFFLKQLQMGTVEHYFFAFLLKWSKEKCLIIEEGEEGRKNKTRLTFVPETFERKSQQDLAGSTVEAEIWNSLIEASDSSYQMSSKEMKKWAQKQADKLHKLDKQLLDDSRDLTIAEGYIKEDTVSFLTARLPYTSITKKGQRLYDHLTQFENHLNALGEDKSLSYKQLIPEESFLMWAGLYGKEEKVIKSIEAIMPDWAEQEIEYIPHYYMYYPGLHVFSSSMHSGYSNGGYSSSGGFGGSTSIGGGGGAMGGGGGGAR